MLGSALMARPRAGGAGGGGGSEDLSTRALQWSLPTDEGSVGGRLNVCLAFGGIAPRPIPS